MTKRSRLRRPSRPLTNDPLWFKDAVIYELHVRAFADSNADGIGDFRGLVERLSYLEDLGVTALWLLPFYPSPLRDDGYDIADYTAVNPAYGTIRDFRYFLDEAHRRGMRVITELAINHTSSDHPWFQRARHAPKGSRHRDYYVWSDTADRYSEARIIFQDFEQSNWTWDPVAEAYYWHRFYSHQPDLNFDNPAVEREVFKVVDFWFELGVDGMRLDAIPYLYEREETNCENLPETHAFLRRLRKHVDQNFPSRMLLAEANQWPEDAAAYFGDGDECHMNFHFPLMPRLFMSVQLESNFPVRDILAQTPQIPDNCQWALFLRNHDELTLEMVTDEDRDYMYRRYAHDRRSRINLGIRRRLAPLLKTRQKIELLNALLLSLPGTPVLYYGDEIGMGDNVFLGDRDGVRTPMQWSPDRNAGFSRANPQQLYLPTIIDPAYHYETINVEAQQNDPSSLLWWTKRIIGLRKEHPVFGRGTISFVNGENRHVLAFVREDGDHTILVIANLSRNLQWVRLPLERFEGWIPVEMFGQTPFPAIESQPYFFSLAAHGFCWFELRAVGRAAAVTGEHGVVSCAVKQDWKELLGARFEALIPALRRYLRGQGWFDVEMLRKKTATLHLVDRLFFGESSGHEFAVALLAVRRPGQEDHLIQLPLAAIGEAGTLRDEISEEQALARVQVAEGDRRFTLVDAGALADFYRSFASLMSRRRTLRGADAAFEVLSSGHLRKQISPTAIGLPVRQLSDRQNALASIDDRIAIKLYRQIERGQQPEVELLDALAESGAQIPTVIASLRYSGDDPATLALVQPYLPHQCTVWSLAVDAAGQAIEALLAAPLSNEASDPKGQANVSNDRRRWPLEAEAPIELFVLVAELLGRRVAELHNCLAKLKGDELAPVSFTKLYQRSLYQAERTRLLQVCESLRRVRGRWEGFPRQLVDQLLERQDELDTLLRGIADRRVEAQRIRCHGHLNLDQVLYTGRDVAFVDFEGHPSLPLSQRRIKRSALTDLATIIVSLGCAVDAARRMPEDDVAEERAASYFAARVCDALTVAYRATIAHGVIPQDDVELEQLMRFFAIAHDLAELEHGVRNGFLGLVGSARRLLAWVDV
ncbi:MAG: maltose alpha-D-glucosyltransferase [Deltaproteobacteria bacterium]|nr:maltose alpha-D-glucosyltransferase [Deltaproteobacteria bacterium]